ncbi:MAG: hypothetical protein M0036_25295 [Desulfobacteraceae bacterium]|nr:hypothetical protein [Desulfobacteraceae bacterium]
MGGFIGKASRRGPRSVRRHWHRPQVSDISMNHMGLGDGAATKIVRISGYHRMWPVHVIIAVDLASFNNSVGTYHCAIHAMWAAPPSPPWPMDEAGPSPPWHQRLAPAQCNPADRRAAESDADSHAHTGLTEKGH